MKLRNMDEVRAYAYAVANEIEHLGWRTQVQNGVNAIHVLIPGCAIEQWGVGDVDEAFEPEPQMQYDRDPADDAAAMVSQAYHQTLSNHVSAKQERLRSVLWKWTPACRGEAIDRAVRKAALNVLQLYPGLTDDVREELDDIVETVGWTIEQAIGQIEVMLNHSPPVDDNPNNHMNYLCAEVRHEATKALLRELVQDLAEGDQDSILPGHRNKQ